MSSTHVFLAIVVALGGCSSGEPLPETTPVTGTVTYKGTPVEGASVVFVPPNSATKPARATTNAQGEFNMRTYFNPENDVEGVVPGQYSVLVTKTEPPDLSEFEKLSPEEQMELSDAGKMPEPKHLLPEKYANPTSSDLKANVQSGQENRLQLELTD